MRIAEPSRCWSQDDIAIGGKILSKVDNSTGSFSGYPARVTLQPGEYRVKALAAGGRYAIVPVIIEAGETTVVSLDGTGGHP